MPDEGSVARLLSRTFAVLIVLIVGAGALRLGAALVQNRVVDRLTLEVQPLGLANDRIGDTVSAAAWAMRGYSLTGDAHMLQLFDDAQNGYAQAVSDLRNLGTKQRRAQIDAEIAKGLAWWQNAEELRVSLPLSATAVALTEQGQQLFDDFHRANDDLQRNLAAEAERLTRRIDVINVTTGVGIGLITLAAAAIAVVTSMRTRRRITRPLREMATLLEKRAEGDKAGRARVEGLTEIRAVAEALNAAADQADLVRRHEEQIRDRLEALDNAKTDFMTTVSHELRTPLTSISGYSELLRDPDTGGLTEPQRRMVEVIARNAARLRELIEDMLTLARIENGEFRSELATVDLAEVIERAIGGITPAAAKASVGLHCDVRGPLPARGDGAQLDRVLVNLLSNAVKFTPADGTVTVRAAQDGDRVALSVADTGIGIPESEKQALFARFFRATNAIRNAIPGTGLGLAIVRTIVGNHGGTIEVDSTENAGTTVTVRLPAG
ncbi:HAMP domain-containing protein [Actinoplanes sp. TBRC 11911]|uniref:sensor histidine kinase n=1 Tax=Actinoplanes sp. TBRC 11911 TaxID=2729386 RepID=UPI00145C69EE|nr:ATP-binding protein [Actinoplanes sp. TBRC 11911]NMO55132.1 HAMP domain-containing protein [Actinoplanes sp. TBRC 11911]